MKNKRKTESNTAQSDPGVVPLVKTVAVRAGAGVAGDIISQSDPAPRPAIARRARNDKMQLHAQHHGVLSRHPLQALVRRGENLRELRQIEKMLRAELKPVGIFAELLFDRAWSSFLRCLLIARLEARLLTPVDQDDADAEPKLKEAELPTLVWPEPDATNYDLSDDLRTHLETVLRYDGHFAREFHRTMGLLLRLRNGGAHALLECL